MHTTFTGQRLPTAPPGWPFGRLLGFTAAVIVLLDRFAGRITSPDPEHEDWPA